MEVSLLIEAESALHSGDLHRALRIAQSIVDRNPKAAEAWAILGVATDLNGQTTEAVRLLERGIAENPSAVLHNDVAIMLQKLNKHVRAEAHLRKAVTVDPSYAPAWLSLANFCAQSNRLAEAERAFRMAISQAPAEPTYPLELARFFLSHGHLAPAQTLVSHADTLSHGNPTTRADKRPNKESNSLRIEVDCRLAAALLRSNRKYDALNHLENAINIGAGQAAQLQFMQLLFSMEFTSPRQSLKPFLMRALEEQWVLPADTARLAAGLLFLETGYKEALAEIGSTSSTIVLSAKTISRLASDSLLLVLLRRTVVADQRLEVILTELRRTLLNAVTDHVGLGSEMPADLLPLTAALANQCYASEYAWTWSASEKASVEILVESLEASIERGESPDALAIAMVAAYRPLHAIPSVAKVDATQWPDALQAVIIRQLREPLIERELRKEISVITPIRDFGSLAVRRQYEENPYPAWIDPPRRRSGQDPAAWLCKTFPQAAIRPLENRQWEMLVAGCGTGQETVGLSLLLDRVNVFAVDLSLTSLSYALRKTRELNIDNVVYACGDILELEVLERQFDIVVSAGVLHHLDRPAEGWRILSNLTRPGGVMLVALYSALARCKLEPARAFAKERGHSNTSDGLRQFRADVLALPTSLSWRAALLARDDFYNLSMLRDLLFHARETQFTIATISEKLGQLDLAFGGFAMDGRLQQQFRNRFGVKANLLALDQWEVFEQENPDTFSTMYHFLAQKPR